MADVKTINGYNIKDEIARTSAETATTAIDNIQIELENRVIKEDGKGLSSNDFTNTYKSKLDTLIVDIEETVVKTMYPNQITNCSPGTNLSSKKAFAKAYLVSALKDATAVDIYIPYDSTAGETEVTLFAADSHKSDYTLNVIKSETVTISETGFYRLDLSGIVLDENTYNGYFFVGFKTSRSDTKIFYNTTADAVSAYTPEPTSGTMLTGTAEGNFFGDGSSIGSKYNSLCAIFYYDEIVYNETSKTKVTAVSDMERDKNLRIVLISDIHYNKDTALGTPASADTYDLERGTAGAERMQIMVDAINAEHSKRPIDFVLFNGDLRTITAENISNKTADLKKLNDTWLSQLKMPYFALRGNHDGYTNEEWTSIIGNKPQFSIETDDYYFICIDVYDYEKAPFYDDSGNHVPTFKYSGSDLYYCGVKPHISWVKEQLSFAKAAGKKVWFVFHTFAHKTNFSGSDTLENIDDTEFIEILQNEDCVLGVIMGHAHIPVLDKKITIADSEVNNGSGYTMTKWNINSGNFGNIPLKDGVTPDNYRFGFKVVEMNPNGLKAYHVYPEMTYPRWKTSSVFGEYENKSFPYTVENGKVIDDVAKNGSADYRM